MAAGETLASSLLRLVDDETGPEISWVWNSGLVGQSLGLKSDRHQHIFERKQLLSDFYTWEKEPIGSGAYGVALPALHVKTNTSCVVKIVSKDKAGKTMRNLEERGKDIFTSLLRSSAERHPNIVSYLDILIGPSLLVAVMEPLNGQELFEYIAERDSLTESFARNVFQQVVAAVSFCYKYGIIHRDVKMENFRFREPGNVRSGLALLDFGLCCPSHPHHSQRGVVGTLLYLAPEIFGGDYSTPVDMWAAGVILYVLLVGSFPFDSDCFKGEGDKKICSDEHIRSVLGMLETSRLPAHAVDLAKSLLTTNPKNRLSAPDAAKHIWFSAPVSEAKLVGPASYKGARQSSMNSPRLHRDKEMGTRLRRQLSDFVRTASGTNYPLQDQGYPCAVLTGKLASSSSPRNIVFLDVDGVLAPCVNSGQLVQQCVEGVVKLCQIAEAQIVVTSVWRKFDGKVEMLKDLIRKHHGADLILDVIPEMDSQKLPEGLPDLDAEHFIRVNEKKGFSLEDGLESLDLFDISDEKSRGALSEAFSDPDFDLQVFSENTREYSRQCFSPRSRRAADWIHDPCSHEFAESRCGGIRLWLHLASKAGFSVKNWVVLDDDDIFHRSSMGAKSAKLGGQQRTRLGVPPPPRPQQAAPLQFLPPARVEPVRSKPVEAIKAVPPANAPKADVQTTLKVETISVDDDDPWAMVF